MLILRRLIWLIKRPVSFPLRLWAMAGAIILVLAIGTVFAASELLITKIAVGVGIMACSLAELNKRMMQSREHLESGPQVMVIFLLVALLITTVCLAVAETLVGSQYVMVGYFLVIAAIEVSHVMFSQYDASYQAKFPHLPKEGLQLHARLSLLNALALAALVLIGTQKLSAEVWLVWVAVVPLAMHPLREWTVIAMWPYEEDADD